MSVWARTSSRQLLNTVFWLNVIVNRQYTSTRWNLRHGCGTVNPGSGIFQNRFWYIKPRLKPFTEWGHNFQVSCKFTSNSSWVSTIKAMYWCNSTEYILTGSISELSLLRRGIRLFTTLFAALIAEAQFPGKFLSSSPKPYSFSFRWRLDMFTFKYNRPTPGGHQRNSAPCSSKYTYSMWSTIKICTVTQHNKAQRCWTKCWFINIINITCIFLATTRVCDEIMLLTNDTDTHKISSSPSAHSRWTPMTSRRNIQHCPA